MGLDKVHCEKCGKVMYVGTIRDDNKRFICGRKSCKENNNNIKLFKKPIFNMFKGVMK